ncbi:MAG: hypothetical protein OJF49_001768 [Ktedonobacterales bacterium]|jgi:hypothetical protein|nr:MAG: hypothetical protein OJF49_001768 [Ktedonobacterales bacterium]
MANMVMTVLEAHVAHEQWPTLQSAFNQSSSRLPSQMVQTFLVQSADDPTLWRGISVWHSRDALDEYRRSVETPGGVLFFRGAGAEPSLSIFEIVSHHTN